MIDFDRLERRLELARPRVIEGRVRSLVGLAIRASIPGVRAGELVEIVRREGPALRAEVVGFHEEEAVLMPLGDVAGVGPDDPVRPSGAPLSIRCGPGLLGRVLSGLGEPMDGKGPLADVEPWSVERPPPDPLRRARVTASLAT